MGQESQQPGKEPTPNSHSDETPVIIPPAEPPTSEPIDERTREIGEIIDEYDLKDKISTFDYLHWHIKGEPSHEIQDLIEQEKKSRELEPLRVETLPILMAEINSMRKAMIIEILLEHKEDKPQGMIASEIRNILAQKLGIENKDKDNTLGSLSEFATYCRKYLAGTIVIYEEEDSRYRLNKDWLGQTESYIYYMFDFNARYSSIPFEVFLNRRKIDALTPNNFPLKIGLCELLYGKIFDQYGDPTGTIVTKMELLNETRVKRRTLQSAIKFLHQLGALEQEKVEPGEITVKIRLRKHAPNEIGSGSIKASAYKILADQRNSGSNEMFTYEGIAEILIASDDYYKDHYSSEDEEENRIGKKNLIKLVQTYFGSWMRKHTELFDIEEKQAIVWIDSEENEYEIIKDIGDLMLQARTQEGYQQRRTKNSSYERFKQNKDHEEASEMWQESKEEFNPTAHALERKKIFERILNILEIRNSASTKVLASELRKSTFTVTSRTKELHDRGEIISILHIIKPLKSEFLYRLPTAHEQIQIEMVKVLTEGGAVVIDSNGNVNVLSKYDERYKAIAAEKIKGEDISVKESITAENSTEPIIIRTLSDDREIRIIQEGNYSHEERRQRMLYGDMKPQVEETLSLMNIAMIQKLSKDIHSLRADSAVTVPQLAARLALVGDPRYPEYKSRFDVLQLSLATIEELAKGIVDEGMGKIVSDEEAAGLRSRMEEMAEAERERNNAATVLLRGGMVRIIERSDGGRERHIIPFDASERSEYNASENRETRMLLKQATGRMETVMHYRLPPIETGFYIAHAALAYYDISHRQRLSQLQREGWDALVSELRPLFSEEQWAELLITGRAQVEARILFDKFQIFIKKNLKSENVDSWISNTVAVAFADQYAYTIEEVQGDSLEHFRELVQQELRLLIAEKK